MLPPQLIQNALESAPDAIIISDASGSIVFANRQVEALFGYSRADIIGHNVEHLLPERLRARHVANRESYTRSPRVRPMGAGLDLFARHKDGNEFPVEISLSPIRDGERILIAAAIRDVADRKRIEAEIVAAREVADRANRAKSRFLATASHDLRQPLQVLALLNGSMRRSIHDPVVLGEALAHQEQAISAMSRLLNALLDISKLESGAIKPDVSDFTVAELFEELRQEFASLAAIKGLVLLVEPCPDKVSSDSSLVEQILRNLVSNAIKYTHVGTVSLRGTRRAATVRIEVLDTGVGIAADQIPYIYDEFFQIGGTPNSTRDGYGLGLSIVSRLVKLLNVTLDIHSDPGKGTRFSIELPAATSHGGTAQAVEPTRRVMEAPRDGRRVLLVEDDASVRDATRMLLRAAGYEVISAASHTEALQKLDIQRGLDLLITDYHLGSGETGVQVIGSIRALLGAEFKSILMTGDTSPEIKGLSRDERLRVASKPIQADELLALMTELLAL